MISRSQHLWNLLLHTRLPRHPLSREERRQSAVNALLAFNVMVRQGDTALATDAKQYTRLIWLMARGGLEWQAYKFFARMLDQGVTPLPATYAALRAATAPSRKTLIQALERKMQEVVLSYPNELARENEKLVAEVTENAEQECTLLSNIENVRVLLQCNTTGEQSHATTQKGNTLLEHDAETNPVVHSSAQSDAAGSSSAYVTVSIDSPPLTWDVFNQYTEKKRLLMSEEKMTLDRTALPEKQKELFRMRLARLSEEELRVILTMHRQFRHGDKDVLLKRVLAYVPYKDIERILKRREAYFQDLRNQLEGIMSAVSASQHTTDLQNNNYDGEYPTDSVDINGNDQFVSKSLTPNEMFLSPREQFEMKPERIPLPWGGVIKKPLHPSEHDVASVSNSSRDVALTSEEVHLVESSVWSQALDLVPTPLLRRYARMFDIMWARDLGEQVQMGTAPCGGLHDRIEFFVRNKEKILREDVPEGFEDLGSAADKPLSDPICTTMGHRPQKDPSVSGSADTICVEEKMHAFDVFNAVARYALEAQVVDDKETNRALLRDRQLRGRTSHAPRNWNPMVSPQGTMQPDTTRASSAGAQVGQMPDFPGNPPLLVGVNHKDHEQHVPERVRITPSMAASGVLSVEDVKRGEVVMDRVDEDTPSVVDGWVRLVQERHRRRQESERKSDESHSASTRRDERLLSEEQQVLSHKEKARARTAARIINQDASRVLLGEASSSPQWASGETELQSVLNPVRDGAILEIGGGRYHSWKERRDGHRRIDRAQQALSVYEPKDSIERRYKRKKMAILKLRKKVLSKKEEERKLKKNVFIPKKQRMMWNVTIPKT